MASVDLESIRANLAQELTPSKSERGKYICPLCGSGSHGAGSTAAFSIYKDGIHGKCFSCGFYGDVFDLVAQRDGLGKVEATRQLIQKYGNALPYAPRLQHQNPVKEKPQQEPQKPIDPAPILAYIKDSADRISGSAGESYLTGRGLTVETIRRYNLGFDPECYNKRVKRKAESIVIPYPGAAYYATRPLASHDYDKPKTEEAGSEPLFNAGALTVGASTVFVVESQLCAISIEQCGGAAVALGGTGAQKLITACKGITGKMPRLMICLDNDEQGQKASGSLCANLQREGIPYTVINIAGDQKDPNELLQKDPEALRKNIAAAQERSTADGAEQLAEYEAGSAAGKIDEFITAILETKNNPAIPTGFSNLDSLLDGGLYAGLYILGAITSLGKSSFILQVADNIARAGYDVLFFALEMAEKELIAKSISRLTFEHCTRNGEETKNAKSTRGILSGKRWQNYSEEEMQIITAAMEEYKAHIGGRIRFIEGVGDIGTAQIKEAVERHISITGRRPVVIVDYVQILAPADVRASDKQNVDKTVLELKRLSRDKNLPVICLSSLNRDNYTAPISSAAFKESGSLEYGSDVLIGLQYKGMDYAEEESDKQREKRIRTLIKGEKERGNAGEAQGIQLKILKNRNGKSGTEALFYYWPTFNTYKPGYTDPEPKQKPIRRI